MYSLLSCLPSTYRYSSTDSWYDKWTAAKWGTSMTCYSHYTATALHLLSKISKLRHAHQLPIYLYPLYTMVATMDYEPDTKGNESYILCADCGTVISSANGAGLCKQLHISPGR